MPSKTKANTELQVEGLALVAKPASGSGCPVILVSASSGGWQVFQQLFSRMPSDTGMAFVIVHSSQGNEDRLMTELLAKYSSMPVNRVEESASVRSDHIYILPSGASFALDGCVLRVLAADSLERGQQAFPSFFRSRAEEESRSLARDGLVAAQKVIPVGLKDSDQNDASQIGQEAAAAEESLRWSEQIYRGIGESIDYGIWICDPEGRNIYASPSFLRLVGLTQEECSVFGWGRALHPDDAGRTIAAWQECVRTGSFWSMEHRYLGVDGKYHPVLARGVPIRDHQGRVVCWAGINLDISDLKQAEESLKAAQEKLSQHAIELEKEVAHRTVKLQETIRSLEGVCYTIAHDLRAPLRAMQGFTTALVEDYASVLDELGADYTRRIGAAAVKMDTLIQDLLTYGRLAHADLSMTWVGLEDLIDGYFAQFSTEIKARKAALYVRRPLPAVWASLTVLEQVVTNLLSNALKFVDAGESPSIKIWAEEDAVGVRLYVKDKGIGIDPRFHERIFAIFERLHAAQEYPGTGIGLAIVRKGLERLGGRVGVDSAPGKGSTFWIELPKP